MVINSQIANRELRETISSVKIEPTSTYAPSSGNYLPISVGPHEITVPMVSNENNQIGFTRWRLTPVGAGLPNWGPRTRDGSPVTGHRLSVLSIEH